MLGRFKNLDKEQKREFYRSVGWSSSSLIGGYGAANRIGVDIGNAVLGWAIGIVIIFVIFRILKILQII